jgi:hypothetical protein
MADLKEPLGAGDLTTFRAALKAAPVLRQGVLDAGGEICRQENSGSFPRDIARANQIAEMLT